MSTTTQRGRHEPVGRRHLGGVERCRRGAHGGDPNSGSTRSPHADRRDEPRRASRRRGPGGAPLATDAGGRGRPGGGRGRHHAARRRREDGADPGADGAPRRARPAHPRRRPLQRSGGRDGARGAGRRADPRRPARPRGDRGPAARPERDPDGRPQVRHQRRAVAHVGDEHHPPRVRRGGDGGEPDRGVLDRQRLPVRPGRLQRSDGGRAAPAGARRLRRELPRARAGAALVLGDARHGGSDLPAQLRDRPALRRAARRRAQGARRRSRST